MLMMEGDNLEMAINQLLKSQAQHIEQVTKLRKTITELQRKRKNESTEEKLIEERTKWDEERTKLHKEKEDLILQVEYFKSNNLEAKSYLDQELKKSDHLKKHHEELEKLKLEQQVKLEKDHHGEVLQIKAECEEKVTKVEADLLAAKQKVELMKTDFQNKMQELQQELEVARASKINLEKKITEDNIFKENNIFKEKTEEIIKNNSETITHQMKFSEETNGDISSPQLPVTPAKESSLERVQDYLKSLPPTSELEDKDITIDDTSLKINTAALKKFQVVIEDEVDNKLDSTLTEDTDESKNVSLNEVDISMTALKDDVSLPGSQASSRVTGVSSQNASRIGSGMFYNMVAETTQITCPFPDQWQHSTIQESIEDDGQNCENEDKIEIDDELD